MSKKTTDKVKVLVTIPQPEGYTKRDIVSYVREAVHAHAGGFTEDPMTGEARKATAKEYKEESAASAEPSLTPVQVFNAIVRDINEISYMPPVDIRQNRREYWKAGARACLSMLNRSLQTTADRMLGERRPQPIDGELFNYWVEEAGRNPSRVAKALAECSTPDDYRAALWLMIKEDEDKALDSKPLLNPEGGLV